MGRMSNHSFRAKIQRKTLTPKWHEEFKIPIITWEFDNVLGIAVRDKDHFYDDILGHYSFYIKLVKDILALSPRLLGVPKEMLVS
ncbi:hypothetical protein JHK85_043998 [Glycine max]|nr:hypothetical protein JHK85_043998 [Glycine max]